MPSATRPATPVKDQASVPTVLEVNHAQCEDFIRRCFDVRRSLMIHGRIGVGKSQTVFRASQEIAKKLGRKFFDWNRSSLPEKQRLLQEPDYLAKMFVFADKRLLHMEPTDLLGLPDLNGDYVIYKPQLLFLVLSQPQAAGMIFLDEIKLAREDVQGSAYQLVLDRCAGELALSNLVGVVAAGNLLEDRVHQSVMSPALVNRVANVVLRSPDMTAFLEYAKDHQFDTRVITFIRSSPGDLYSEPSTEHNCDAMGFATPRGWEHTSMMISGMSDLDYVSSYAAACIGFAIAQKFTAFLKLTDAVDAKKILADQAYLLAQSLDIRLSALNIVVHEFGRNLSAATYCMGYAKDLYETKSHPQARELGILLLKLYKAHKPAYIGEVMDRKPAEFKDFAQDVLKYIHKGGVSLS